MRDGKTSAIVTFGSLAIVVALAGCSGSSWQFWKKSSDAQTPTEPAVATAAPAAPAPVTASAPPASSTQTETVAAPAPSSNGFREHPALSDVRFRPGQVVLAKTDLKTLDSVAQWLKDNPRTQVMIEAHTDDLGTREGNIAAGEKRATSIKAYLVSKGLDANRISMVSVGAERPACMDKTDVCRAKNRRARFLVKQN
jgi:peptidoglycan-associated lipoprotein